MSRYFPLFVFTLVFCLHIPGLHNGFHYNDAHSIVENPHIRDLGRIYSFFTDPQTFSVDPAFAMYRPLVLSSYALNYAIGAYEPRSYQLFNLLIHALSSVLVYFLLRRFSLSAAAALFAALLFGLHPLQSEAVNYIGSTRFHVG